MPKDGKIYKRMHLTKMAFLNQVLLYFSIIYKLQFKAYSEVPQSYPPAELTEASTEPAVEQTVAPTEPPVEQTLAPTESPVEQTVASTDAIFELDMDVENMKFDEIFKDFATKNNFLPFDS